MSDLTALMNQTLPPIDTTEPPKFCRCTQSSVAHVRGCWLGWGDTRSTTKESEPQKETGDTLPPPPNVV